MGGRQAWLILLQYLHQCTVHNIHNIWSRCLLSCDFSLSLLKLITSVFRRLMTNNRQFERSLLSNIDVKIEELYYSWIIIKIWDLHLCLNIFIKPSFLHSQDFNAAGGGAGRGGQGGGRKLGRKTIVNKTQFKQNPASLLPAAECGYLLGKYFQHAAGGWQAYY